MTASPPYCGPAGGQISLVKEFGISMYEKIYENSKRPMTTRGDNEIFTKEENVNEHRGYYKVQREWSENFISIHLTASPPYCVARSWPDFSAFFNITQQSNFHS